MLYNIKPPPRFHHVTRPVFSDYQPSIIQVQILPQNPLFQIISAVFFHFSKTFFRNFLRFSKISMAFKHRRHTTKALRRRRTGIRPLPVLKTISYFTMETFCISRVPRTAFSTVKKYMPSGRSERSMFSCTPSNTLTVTPLALVSVRLV